MIRAELHPRNVQALMSMPPPKCKEELQSVLGIVNYICKLSPMTAEVYKPLRKLTSVKTIWAWNSTYQELYDNAKTLIQQSECMHEIL